MKPFLSYLSLLTLMGIACHSKPTPAAEDETPAAITPVTIVSPESGNMAEYTDLNATSTYLLKAIVKANANGYIQSASPQPGKYVSAGQNLFIIRTKEAESIGNTINLLDTSFKFTGLVRVKTGIGGYVTEVDHQAGDYVQEGEQLAVISDANSFVFILNLPYELRPYVLNNKTADLLLPDGKTLKGYISSVVPVVDSASQTQNVILKVAEKNLPVNLIAKVRVVKSMKENAISLPKQSILSDETQGNFWVMKLIDSSTAVKVQVTKGMELNNRVEILSPVFNVSDKFLLTGNYGLGDTARIRIVHE